MRYGYDWTTRWQRGYRQLRLRRPSPVRFHFHSIQQQQQQQRQQQLLLTTYDELAHLWAPRSLVFCPSLCPPVPLLLYLPVSKGCISSRHIRGAIFCQQACNGDSRGELSDQKCNWQVCRSQYETAWLCSRVVLTISSLRLLVTSRVIHWSFLGPPLTLWLCVDAGESFVRTSRGTIQARRELCTSCFRSCDAHADVALKMFVDGSSGSLGAGRSLD